MKHLKSDALHSSFLRRAASGVSFQLQGGSSKGRSNGPANALRTPGLCKEAKEQQEVARNRIWHRERIPVSTILQTPGLTKPCLNESPQWVACRSCSLASLMSRMPHVMPTPLILQVQTVEKLGVQGRGHGWHCAALPNPIAGKPHPACRRSCNALGAPDKPAFRKLP